MFDHQTFFSKNGKIYTYNYVRSFLGKKIFYACINMKGGDKTMSREFLLMYSNLVGYGKLFAPNEVGLKCFADFYANYMKYKAMSLKS